MYRNMSNYWLRLAVYVAIAISLGTIFYDVGSSSGSIQVRETKQDSAAIIHSTVKWLSPI